MRNNSSTRGSHGTSPSKQPPVSRLAGYFVSTLTNYFISSYGVTRVYSQQAGYVLADAQSAQNSLRMLFKTVRRAELDQEAGKARY